MLELKDVNAGYGNAQVLFDLTLTAYTGEILCLLGRNGAGKTTTLKAIMGQLPLTAGEISLDGQRLNTLQAHQIPKQGVGYVPQGRRLFKDLSVADNIQVGLSARKVHADTRQRVLSLFPRLMERLSQRAGTLSGGEQQMLAMARALCLEPTVLLLDEPTEGLQPSMVDLIRDVIVQMREENVAIILVEQRVSAVLSIADSVTFIENGRSMETTTADALKHDSAKITHYLGV